MRLQCWAITEKEGTDPGGPNRQLYSHVMDRRCSHRNLQPLGAGWCHYLLKGSRVVSSETVWGPQSLFYLFHMELWDQGHKENFNYFFILVLFTIWFHSTQINQILCSFCWTWLKQSLVCSYYYSPQLVDTKLYMFGYWRHLLDSQISGNTWSSSVLCNSLWCLSNEPFITKLINRLVTSLRIIWFDGRSFFTNFVRQICVQIIWHKY